MASCGRPDSKLQLPPDSPASAPGGALPPDPASFALDPATLIAGALLILVFAGLGLFALMVRRREAPSRPRGRRAPRAASGLLLEHSPDPSEGYRTLRAFTPGMGEDDRLAVLARPEEKPAPGLRAIDAAVVYAGGRMLVSILVCEGRAGWRAGDALYVEAAPGSTDTDPANINTASAPPPALLQEALASGPVRAFARDAQEIICIGLAGPETGASPRDLAQLACERAIHLPRALINLGIVRRERTIGLALGVAPSQQTGRAIVLIAIRQTFRADMEADAIQAAVDVLAANGLRLDSTSLAAAPLEFWNIAPGALAGFVGAEWQKVSETSYRGV